MFPYMCNCLENVNLQVESQAYLVLRKGFMQRLGWFFVYFSDDIEISILCVCVLPFSWEVILVNSLPIAAMKPKCKNVLWLTESKGNLSCSWDNLLLWVHSAKIVIVCPDHSDAILNRV